MPTTYSPLPPSAGDLFHMLRGYGFPAVSAGGVDVPAGEAACRHVLEGLSETARTRFYEAWCKGPSSANSDRGLQPAAGARSAAPISHSSWGDVNPSAAELAVVIRAYKAVLARGLRLPASAFRIRWYWRDEPDQVLGVMDPTKRPIEIHIARGQTEVETFRTLTHEFLHAADVLSGRYAALDKAEQERRAEALSYQCVVAEYGVFPL